MELVVLVILALVAYLIWNKGLPLRQTVTEGEGALLFRNGQYQETLEPGRHRVWPGRDEIKRFDLRAQLIEVPGQEILTADLIALKLSVTATYRITDPLLHFRAGSSPVRFLYTSIQLALRDVVAARQMEKVLSDREGIAAAIQPAVAHTAGQIGAEIEAIAIRDVMLPTTLKRGQLALHEAKLDAQAKLEAARGETAVLRSLANAARTMETTPGLYRARVLQELKSGRHTIVLGSGDLAAVATENSEK